MLLLHSTKNSTITDKQLLKKINKVACTLIASEYWREPVMYSVVIYGTTEKKDVPQLENKSCSHDTAPVTGNQKVIKQIFKSLPSDI